jgi:hypothetical protein
LTSPGVGSRTTAWQRSKRRGSLPRDESKKQLLRVLFFEWVTLIKHVINLFVLTFDFSTGAGSRTTARKGSKRRGSSPRDEGYNQVNICGFFSLGPFYHTCLIYFSPLLTSLQMQDRKLQRGSAANAEGRRRGTRGDIRVSACTDSSLCQFY